MTEINWEASLTAKHRALELVAAMLRGEYGERPIVEIVETWGPLGLTDVDLALVREVFPAAEQDS